jgi:hypothetical protein
MTTDVCPSSISRVIDAGHVMMGFWSSYTRTVKVQDNIAPSTLLVINMPTVVLPSGKKAKGSKPLICSEGSAAPLSPNTGFA